MNDKILVDSSFFVALYDASAKHHQSVKKLSITLKRQLVIPIVVFPEVFYVLRKNVGGKIADGFARDMATLGLVFQDTRPSDFSRIYDLRTQYADADLDFVDCAIIAIAERLEIKRIATLDHRDFALVRPKHCDYFEIYP